MMKLSHLTACLTFLASFAGMPTSAAPPPGAEPIVIAPGTLLEKDHQAKRLAWVGKHLLPTAKQGWQGKAWAADAEGFCAQALPAWIDGTAGPDSQPELAEAGRQLMAKGCHEPLACFLAYHCARVETLGWRRETFAPMKLPSPKDEAPVPPVGLGCIIADAYIRLSKTAMIPSGTMEKKQAERLLRAVNDGSYGAEFDTVFLRDQIDMLDAMGKRADEAYAQMIETYAKSAWPEWVRLTLIGNAEVEWAWMRRGGDWASKVAPEGWEGFAEHLKKAHEALSRAHTLRPDRPEAAALMIKVSMGENLPSAEQRKWFDLATAAQFDYTPAYLALIYAHLPRWGGSEELMLHFGKACADTRRYDTDVPSQLYLACQLVGLEKGDPWPAFSHALVAASNSATVRGYLEHPDLSPAKRKSLASLGALTAWFAGDNVAAAKAMEAAGPRLHWRERGSLALMKRHQGAVRRSVLADSGVWGESVQNIEKLAKSGKLQEVRDAVAKVVAADLPSDAARAYVAEAAAWSALPEKLKDGAWHKLPLFPGLGTWLCTGGDWEATAAGDLVCKGNDSITGDLMLSVSLPLNLELRGELTHETKGPKPIVPINWAVGPAFGWLPAAPDKRFGSAVRGLVKDSGRGQRHAMITSVNLANPPASTPIPTVATYKFHLSLKEGKATLQTNDDAPVTASVSELEGVKQDQGLMGFVTHSLPAGAEITLRHLELRRTDVAAP